jgi:hypothetical protein
MEAWAEIANRFRTERQVPTALANADLLVESEPRWSGLVEVHTSHYDLRFVCPGGGFFALRSVRVTFRPNGDTEVDDGTEGTFSFELWLPSANNPRVDVLRSADKASKPTAAAVLDAFLMQLTGESD